MADNLTDTIGNILSDPEAMKKISELSRSLGLSGESPPQSEAPKESKGFPDIGMLSSLLSGSSKETEQNSTSQNFLSSLMSSEGEIVRKVISFLPLLRDVSKEDESTRLLEALRPFLSERKKRRLEEAEKMMKIMKLLPLLRSTGFF